MRKLRIYLDTSVISMIDAPHVPVKEAITKAFFRYVTEHPEEFELLISPVLVTEIKKCQSDEKRSKLLDLLNDIPFTFLPETMEVENLVNIFLAEKVLGERHQSDLMHLAYAVVARCDYIVSWNFRHFVNYRTIKRVNAVVKDYNYGGVFIVTPETFIGEQYHEID